MNPVQFVLFCTAGFLALWWASLKFWRWWFKRCAEVDAVVADALDVEPLEDDELDALIKATFDAPFEDLDRVIDVEARLADVKRRAADATYLEALEAELAGDPSIRKYTRQMDRRSR